MLKFEKWLYIGLKLTALWIILLLSALSLSSLAPWVSHIKLLPVYAVLLFGIYSASIVLWRVYKFNNCEEAAKELFQDISQARDELSEMGFEF